MENGGTNLTSAHPCVTMDAMATMAAAVQPMTRSPGVVLPSLPLAEPLSEAVLFGFDDRSFPFQHHVHTHLTMGQRPQIVLRPGLEGSHDEVVLFYGTVLRIGD